MGAQKMQALQPQIQELQKKHGGNKEKLVQEQQLQLLSTQINSLRRDTPQAQFGVTGHPTRFMTYGHYYQLGR